MPEIFFPITSQSQDAIATRAEPSSVILKKDYPFFVLDLDNPLATLILLYASKRAIDIFNKANKRMIQSLWFAQIKDDRINTALQVLREAIGCDRVVLGLIGNGEKVGEYHLRKLVITHDNCAPGIASLVSQSNTKLLSVLGKERSLYADGVDFVRASVSDKDLDPSCRRYMDSIDIQSIWTFKMNTSIQGKDIEIGYLSFQWSDEPPEKILDAIALDNLLKSKKRHDLTYYRNQICSTVLSSRPRMEFLSNISRLLKIDT